MTFPSTFLASTLAIPFALASAPAFAQKAVKVVYHIDNAEVQATAALRTLRNYLDTAPDTKIVVVALGDGVHFLKEGAKDKKNPNIDYGSLVSDLVGRGVSFEVCELTLKAADMKKDQFVLDANFTPSGVVRIGQLQVLEGYGYIKP